MPENLTPSLILKQTADAALDDLDFQRELYLNELEVVTRSIDSHLGTEHIAYVSTLATRSVRLVRALRTLR